MCTGSVLDPLASQVPGALFKYRAFLDNFWPTDARQPHQLSEGRRQAMLGDLLARVARQMADYAAQTGSDLPPALQMLERMRQADPEGEGCVALQSRTRGGHNFPLICTLGSADCCTLTS